MLLSACFAQHTGRDDDAGTSEIDAAPYMRVFPGERDPCRSDADCAAGRLCIDLDGALPMCMYPCMWPSRCPTGEACILAHTSTDANGGCYPGGDIPYQAACSADPVACVRGTVCWSLPTEPLICHTACGVTSDCEAGHYCLWGSCIRPCTLDGTVPCTGVGICVAGVCRRPSEWADCRPSDGGPGDGVPDCPLGTGCRQIFADRQVCDTVEEAFCDGGCPGDRVCFYNQCSERR